MDQVRARYEQELGTFLVRFNEMERILHSLIGFSLSSVDRVELAVKLCDDTFSRKLCWLRAIAEDDHRLGGINFDEIEKINRERNFLAHGAFVGDIYSGHYYIHGKKSRDDITPEYIAGLTQRLTVLLDALSELDHRLFLEEIGENPESK